MTEVIRVSCDCPQAFEPRTGGLETATAAILTDCPRAATAGVTERLALSTAGNNASCESVSRRITDHGS
jgi:hypothetical protein